MWCTCPFLTLSSWMLCLACYFRLWISLILFISIHAHQATGDAFVAAFIQVYESSIQFTFRKWVLVIVRSLGNARLKTFRALKRKKKKILNGPLRKIWIHLCSWRQQPVHVWLACLKSRRRTFICCFMLWCPSHSPSASWRNLCWPQLPINSYLLFSSAWKTHRQ